MQSVQKSWLLSIMSNRPVRDKWDYPRKMERHFPIKLRQPIGIALVTILSFPNFLIRAKNRFVKNGTANFDRNIPTEISGPPPEVILNTPVGRNRNAPFHLNSDRNFRNLWHNGKHPLFFIVKYANLWGFCCRRRRGCLSSLILIKCHWLD